MGLERGGWVRGGWFEMLIISGRNELLPIIILTCVKQWVCLVLKYCKIVVYVCGIAVFYVVTHNRSCLWWFVGGHCDCCCHTHPFLPSQLWYANTKAKAAFSWYNTQPLKSCTIKNFYSHCTNKMSSNKPPQTRPVVSNHIKHHKPVIPYTDIPHT